MWLHFFLVGFFPFFVNPVLRGMVAFPPLFIFCHFCLFCYMLAFVLSLMVLFLFGFLGKEEVYRHSMQNIYDRLRVCWSKKMEMKYNLQYRNVVMGVAIVWIFLYHVPINQDFLLPLTQKGFAGVDIFVFLTGVGCYYSLTSNPDGYEFIKRRVLRIAPAYWTFVILFHIPLWHSRLHFPEDYVAILSFVLVDCNNECQLHNSPRPNRVNWYIGGMWIFYGILPVLVPFVQQHITNLPRLVYGIAFLTILSVAFFFDVLEAGTFFRMPVLLAGVYFGKCSKTSSTLKPSRWIPLVLLIFVGFWCLSMREVALVHTTAPISLLVPGSCLVISCAAEYLQNWTVGRFTVRLFSIMGEHSFEILLWHSTLSDYFILVYPLREKNYVRCFFYIFVATFVGTITVRKISLRLEPKCNVFITWFENWYSALEKKNRKIIV